ncbi:hypothetical protein F4861DRAFT_524096 [Xylaria intraflava]|nr:hypothetical protein F4861DRAFT_524096 [Xylaria intraflava]
MSLCPSDSVFNTVELLECILFELDMRALLMIQRVNSLWRDTIASSPRIQESLYFRPAATQKPPIRNPMLLEAFPLWFLENANLDRQHFPKRVRLLNLERLPISQESRKEAFEHPGASWRRMLVQQPPIPSLGRLEQSVWPANSHELHFDQFPDGLRMGFLYDYAADWLRKTVPGTKIFAFNVFWNPSVVSTNARFWYTRRMEAARTDELTALTAKSNVFLACTMMERREIVVRG